MKQLRKTLYGDEAAAGYYCIVTFINLIVVDLIYILVSVNGNTKVERTKFTMGI